MWKTIKPWLWALLVLSSILVLTLIVSFALVFFALLLPYFVEISLLILFITSVLPLIRCSIIKEWEDSGKI